VTEWARLIEALPVAIAAGADQDLSLSPSTRPLDNADPTPEQLAQERVHRAKMLQERGELEGAITELEQAYQIMPQVAGNLYARALLSRGVQRQQAGDQTGALSDYRRAQRVALARGLKDEIAAKIVIVQEQLQQTVAHDLLAPPMSPSPWWMRGEVVAAVLVSLVVLTGLLAWALRSNAAQEQGQFQATAPQQPTDVGRAAVVQAAATPTGVAETAVAQATSAPTAATQNAATRPAVAQAAAAATPVDTQTATAQATPTLMPTPSPVPSPTPVPLLRVARANQNERPTCISMQIQGVATTNWTLSANGINLRAARFDDAGKAQLCGLRSRQQFTFNIYNAGRKVPGGEGIAARGGDAFVGEWR
jgi:tetratricopeptide (TPR) repeat protein